MITILGLGPGQFDQLTLHAWRTLEQASEVYLRTKHHPLVSELPQKLTYHSFDTLYDQAKSFETLYQTIADQIIELGQRPQGVIYAVPGHPMIGEQTTQLIMAAAQKISLPVHIIDGLSFIEPTLNLLGIDAMSGLQIHDAAEIAQLHHPPLNPDLPTLIAQVYSRDIASHTKLTLMNQYPDEYKVTLIHRAGTSEAKLEHLPLYEIDHSPYIAYWTTLYIPAMPAPSSFEALQEVMAHLRAPEGCPWDQKQTHQSLRPYFLEETYEVLEALDADDPVALAEELGDVLLHLIFQGQIAVDEGEFHFTEVIQKLIAKLISRHPHVWGDVAVQDAQHVERNWEAIKLREQAEKKTRDSHLDGVPHGLPALVQAFRLQERAASVGFDWQEVEPVIQKVYEEIDEIKQNPSHDELGDLLFSVVNWARWLKIDPESALRETNARFRRRFAYIEANAGKSLAEMTLAEMDSLWDEAKSRGIK